MSDIPADILKAAEDAFDKLLCNDTESCGGSAGLRKAAINDIALAILAERERGISIFNEMHARVEHICREA